MSFLGNTLIGVLVPIGLLRLSPNLSTGARIFSAAAMLLMAWAVVLSGTLVSAFCNQASAVTVMSCQCIAEQTPELCSKQLVTCQAALDSAAGSSCLLLVFVCHMTCFTNVPAMDSTHEPSSRGITSRCKSQKFTQLYQPELCPQIQVARVTGAYPVWLSIFTVLVYGCISALRVVSGTQGYIQSVIFAIAVIIGQFAWPARLLWEDVSPPC